MKKSDELKITLEDYINLLNKYNSNSEFLNGKIRILMKQNNNLEVVLSVFSVVSAFLIAGIIILYIGLY